MPVYLILKEAGIKPEATLVEFSAPDNYYRVLPLESALQNGVFLAYKVDGHVLAKNGGYPLRLVAKDKVGAIWARVLTHIELK